MTSCVQTPHPPIATCSALSLKQMHAYLKVLNTWSSRPQPELEQSPSLSTQRQAEQHGPGGRWTLGVCKAARSVRRLTTGGARMWGRRHRPLCCLCDRSTHVRFTPADAEILPHVHHRGPGHTPPRRVRRSSVKGTKRLQELRPSQSSKATPCGSPLVHPPAEENSDVRPLFLLPVFPLGPALRLLVSLTLSQHHEHKSMRAQAGEG